MCVTVLVIYIVLVSSSTSAELTEIDVFNDSSIDICPTWYLPNSTSDSNESSCYCGDEYGGLVRCNREEESISALRCNCVTSDNDGRLVLGQCLYTCSNSKGNDYIAVPKNVSELNSKMCGSYHRKGVLCGNCEEGYAISAFSVELFCVKCPHSNWLVYFAVTLLPLTIFYFIVLLFRFQATSPWLDAYILFSQVVTSPGTTRLVIYGVADGGAGVNTPILTFIIGFAQGVYGIWNLNFFQLLFPSFCIDPQLSSLDIIALDYLTAFYPLFLILLTYIVLQLYSHNFKPLVLLWKPFRRVLIRFHKKASIKTSIIDVFATFILLSYVKLIYVSSDILDFSIVRRPDSNMGSITWVHNGSILYFGRTHAGFGILAIVVSLSFVLVPVLLLCLYPFQFFQKYVMSHLDKIKPQIQAYVDCFQGHYKDGTNGTRDCRHFSAAYLFVWSSHHTICHL